MRTPRNERGFALIVLMVIIIVVTMMGIWGLKSSQIGIGKAGYRSAQTKLHLVAEEGLQKALRRVQEIANYGGGLTDTVGHLTLPDLLALPQNTDNPSCTDNFGNDTDRDVVTENVICNFLGGKIKNAQVILVRKANVASPGGSTTTTNAIFLVNSLARDDQDRRQLVQGVIVVPYSVPGEAPQRTPYLATSSKGVD